MVPARMRRIDRALARRGIDWSWPELARLDPGRSESPPDRSYWVCTAVQVMLSGGAGIDMGTAADAKVRALAASSITDTVPSTALVT